MNKGLKALEELRAYAMASKVYHSELDIIEKELKEKEKQDNYIKTLEDRIDNLEASYSRHKKAFDIIKEKRVNIRLFLIDKECELYNMNYGYDDLTEEEYDLLKEVLL